MKRTSLKNFLAKMIVRSVGAWSDGIGIAMREGFTSGIMLDYIYKNQPSGKYGIGKLIDRAYLGHEGWRAVRQRKDNLCANLERAVRMTLEAKGRAHICDVAAGPALYITDILEKQGNAAVSAEIRDLDARWLEEAKKRADAKGLNLAYRVADALDQDDFVFAAPPDIFVASGFYDWFTDASLIRKSMRLIHDSLPVNGCFVFTNQTGHAALDMANGLFTDFNKKPLSMVTWDAELVNSWAVETGFTILDIRKDEKGYYSNVLAVKAG